jgi:predicted HTH transcriptional regulator
LSKYIYDIIKQGENQQLDFKFEINDARKIAKTLVAFSNTDGGKLLIGVKDNGRIAGVRSEEEFYMLESASSMYCKPIIPFITKRWEVDGKTVLEVDIPAGEEKPYLSQTAEGRWLAYVRVADQNILANSIQLRVWENQRKKKGAYLRYTEAEEKLLTYLRENGEITLNRFCHVAGISRRKASYVLVTLISMKIIKIVFTEKQTWYELTGTGPENADSRQ